MPASISVGELMAAGVQDPAAQAITQAYDQVIGRDPAAAELALGEQQLQAGFPIANLRVYLAATGYAAAAVSAIYTGALGRPVTAPELASDERDLAAGGSLAGLLGYLATTTEASSALDAVYAAVVGRQFTPAELAAGQAQLAASVPLASIRATLAAGAEAASKIQAVYADVAGRTPTSAELAGVEAAIGSSGASLSILRSYFAGTAEAASKLQVLYTTELGRAVTPGELAGDEQAIANGSSLAAIRGYLSTSLEAYAALAALYNTKQISTGISVEGVTSAEQAALNGSMGQSMQALASGISLVDAVAMSPAAMVLINNIYRNVLGILPDAGMVSAGEQALIGGTISSLTTSVVNTPAFADDINAAFQAAIGQPANAVELAANKSELSFGQQYFDETSQFNVPPTPVNLATLQAVIGELSGRPVPSPIGFVSITPQTIAGSPGLVYGLLQNDAFIAQQPAGSPGSQNSPGAQADGTLATVFGFNPKTDLLQLESKQVPNFGALAFTQVPATPYSVEYTQVNLGGGATIALDDVQQSSLTPANFHFV